MRIKSLFSIIVLFLMLYYPPIYGTVTLNYLGFISWIYLIVKFDTIVINFKVEKIVKLVFTLVLFTIYLLVLAIINNNPLNIASDFFYWIVDIIPCSLMLSHIYLKRRLGFYEILTQFLIVGNIQGFFALLAFTIPSFQHVFIQNLILFGYSNEIFELAKFRMYGFANSLNYSTPIFQGILAICAIYLTIKKDVKYLIFFPLLFLSAVINARASIVIMFLGFIIMLLPKGKLNIRIVMNFILVLIAGFTSIVILYSFLEKYAPTTHLFIEEGIEEIIQLFNGDTSGYYFSYITDPNKYILPNDAEIWFGKGASSLELYGLQSDVGWINDIWRGGILYGLFIYLIFIRLLYNIRRNLSKQFRMMEFITTYMLFALIASNFKGFIFSVNEITSFILILYIFFTCVKVTKSENQIE